MTNVFPMLSIMWLPVSFAIKAAILFFSDLCTKNLILKSSWSVRDLSIVRIIDKFRPFFPIRIRVNKVESIGKPVGDKKNEWMWFYDKKGVSMKDKIIKKKFPEEVLGNG